MTIGVIGLGVMGSAMSKNIIAGGHDVVGFDVDPLRAAEFVGEAVDSVATVVDRASVVLLSLPSVGALETVAREIADAAPTDTVVVEMGTLPLDAKQAAHDQLADVGVPLLDTPVSGTGLQAADATLVVYSSGPENAHHQAEPIFSLIGKATHYLGEFGNGSRMKYVANLLVAVQTLAAAEAHALGAACGLDPQRVQEVIAAGVGTSAMFEIRGPMMAADNYEPPSARLDIILKDAGIIAAHARSVGVTTPLLDCAIPMYQQGSDAGYGDMDAASLRRFLDDLSEGQ